MTKTVILGRKGNQPFEIVQQGVSGEHAKLTVEKEDGHDVWVLEDLNSSNGTYVRDENGRFVQILKKTITPDTYICLGPDNVNGSKFYARHILDGRSYTGEFNYLEDMEQSLRNKMERSESLAKTIRKVIAAVSALALVGSFVVPGDSLRMMLLRLGTIVSVAATMFYDPSKEKKRLKNLRERLFECPNPACSHTLTGKEIHNRRCSKCKAQG